MNDTILNFNYPDTLLKEYNYWVVLLRPKQVTLGSMVLICKENKESLSALSPEVYAELSTITYEIEATLKRNFNMNKINYLALMMVDKHVHFHVIPRYSKNRFFEKVEFYDRDWPKPPNLATFSELNANQFKNLHNYLVNNWN